MKRVLFLCLSLLLFISCDDITLGEGEWQIPVVYDVAFSPSKIQRGQELTITFNVPKRKYNEHFETVEVIDDQLIITNNSEDSNYYNTKNLVNFNIKFAENAEPFTHIENGKTSISYDSYILDDALNPDKYTYFKWDSETGDGEVRCIVPEKAVCGVIKLEGLGLSNCGFSEEKLIIVDENGNEIE